MHSKTIIAIAALVLIGAAGCQREQGSKAEEADANASSPCAQCEAPPVIASTYSVCNIEKNYNQNQEIFAIGDAIVVGADGTGGMAGIRNITLRRAANDSGALDTYWGVARADGVLAGTVPLLHNDTKTVDMHLVRIAQEQAKPPKCDPGKNYIAIDVCRLVDPGVEPSCEQTGPKGSALTHGGAIHAQG